ncbi:MAG: hypothetical protein JWO86_8390 [Myxococcaceae bacterium]|jgi:hypothetical protein|nr:hypothetical protein [Myxococcaceae bacterium]MEA2747701.1 hypothetical protein [Myxococcales bacterium]
MKTQDMSARWALVLVLATTACSSTTMEESKPTKVEALQKFTLASECSKWMECDPEGLAATHEGGVDGCVTDDVAQLTRILGPELLAQPAACTQDKLEQCSNSYATAACPSDDEIHKGNYLPHAPDASCAACGWHE